MPELQYEEYRVTTDYKGRLEAYKDKYRFVASGVSSGNFEPPMAGIVTMNVGLFNFPDQSLRTSAVLRLFEQFQIPLLDIYALAALGVQFPSLPSRGQRIIALASVWKDSQGCEWTGQLTNPVAYVQFMTCEYDAIWPPNCWFAARCHVKGVEPHLSSP